MKGWRNSVIVDQLMDATNLLINITVDSTTTIISIMSTYQHTFGELNSLNANHARVTIGGEMWISARPVL